MFQVFHVLKLDIFFLSVNGWNKFVDLLDFNIERNLFYKKKQRSTNSGFVPNMILKCLIIFKQLLSYDQYGDI